MRVNPTLQRQLTPEELAERQAWYEQTQKDAADLSERLRQQAEQEKQSRDAAKLQADTGLTLSQLHAVREWLRNNPVT